MSGEKLTSSVLAEFAPEESSSTFVLEKSARVGDSFTGYVRLHPSGGASLRVLSGSIQRFQTGLSKHVEEYISFSNGTEAFLRYPGVSGLTWEVIGKVYGGGSPQYDGVRKRFYSKAPITCLIKASYQASYDLYKVTFGGVCPTLANIPKVRPKTNPDDDNAITGRPPTVVVGVNGNLVRSLSLEAPPCPGVLSSAIDKMGATLPQIKVEQDPKNPPQLWGLSEDTTFAAKSGPGAFCIIRAYPQTPDFIDVTSGSLSQIGTGVTAEVVKENLGWSGSGSVNLTYYPVNGVSIQAVGEFIDSYGRSFTPSFALPGSLVDVPYEDAYGNVEKVESRNLGPTEVAVIYAGLVVNKAYGVAKVEYVASFVKYLFEFQSYLEAGVTKFQEAYVVASLGGVLGNLKVAPPRTKGKV